MKYLDVVTLEPHSEDVYLVDQWALLKRKGYCPVCCEEVFPRRLRKKRGYGAVHFRGSDCAGTLTAESEHHKNAKNNIAERCIQQLADLFAHAPALPFWVQGHTSGLTFTGWTQVVVEHPVGSYFLDVALLYPDSTVALGIEVCHAHPVPPAKIEGLRRLSVNWIEVKAQHGIDWRGAPRSLPAISLTRTP